ncbi:nSTAND1 domain-containing NTPase [Microbispora hainanensis]|uniref:nSTAND1 domain-containing NTPase n=1 Tax=Microbispora hainanensis TaxID=568844 RepID=UPI0033C63D50
MTGSGSRPERATVRILANGNRPVGLGFLVGQQQIVTCAHVVNSALGREQREPAGPPDDTLIFVDFPLGGDGRHSHVRPAKIVRWRPGGVHPFEWSDIAGLELLEPPPQSTAPARLRVTGSPAGTYVQVWGFLHNRRVMGHVTGELLGAADPVRSQVDRRITSRMTAAPGFSGGPVWHRDSGEVVGMLQAIAGDEQIYMIGLHALAAAWPAVLHRPPRNPYRGLLPFEESDAELFFGRAGFVEQLVDDARSRRLLAVTGPSGCGKSSVVNAGLIPRLRRESLRSGSSMHAVRLRPGELPMFALAREFAAAEGRDAQVQQSQIERWRSRLLELGLRDAGRRLAIGLNVDRLVVVVDQAEEILTRCTDAGERSTFLDLLAETATELRPSEQADITVVLTIREEHFGGLLQHQRLGEYLQMRSRVLRALSDVDLRTAITEPARLADPEHPVVCDEDLIEALCADFGRQPGRLPLLQFVLHSMWPLQDPPWRLTRKTYEDMGGASALSKYADKVIEGLPQRQRDAAERIFTMLVTPGTSDYAQPVRRDRLSPDDLEVAGILHDKRLVTFNGETVEVVHEALLRGWDRLRDLLARDSEVLAMVGVIQGYKSQWENHDQDPKFVLPAPLLERAFKVVEEHPHHAMGVMPYVVHSMEVHREEQRNQERLLAYNEATRLAEQSEFARLSPAETPTTALDLAIRSLERMPLFKGDRALREALASTTKPELRLEHDDAVRCVAYSPDGFHLATAGFDGTVCVWEAATGRARVTIRNAMAVWSIAFSPDGELLATGGHEDQAKIYDVRTGTPVGSLPHGDTVWAVDFSPDGRFLATACGDGRARLWDPRGGHLLATMAHDDVVRNLAFHPGGSVLATASADATVGLWAVPTGVEIARLPHDGWVRAVVFSADGALASASRDERARIWTAERINNIVATGGRTRIQEENRLKHSGWVRTVAFSPDGSLLATAGRDGSARIWDAQSGTPIQHLHHEGSVESIAFSPDGTRLAVAGDSKTAHVWDARTGNEAARVAHDGPVNWVVFSPDGAKLATAGADATACVWNVHASDEIARLTHDSWVEAVAFDHQGTRVATACYCGEVQVWDVASGTSMSGYSHTGPAQSVAFSVDGRLLASAGADGHARVREIGTGREIAELPHPDWIRSIALSLDSRLLATGGADRIARIWEIETGNLIAQFPHDETVWGVEFSPDGKLLATACADRCARLWSIADGEVRRVLRHTDIVWGVSFARGGRRLATASAEYARIWPVHGEDAPLDIRHDAAVESVAFSPDGSHLAAGCQDGDVRIWSVRGAQEPSEVARVRHEEAVWGLSFSPDGRYLATAGRDSTARIWPATSAALIELATRHLARPIPEDD